MKLSNRILQFGLSAILVVSLFSCGKHPAQPSVDSGPLYYQSAAELAGAIKRGEITSAKLLETYLERINRYNGKINAVVAMDVTAARARAQEADKALAQGKVWGPLHGLPMTVKDVFEVKGMPAASGDPRLKNYIPKKNAIAVQRLIDAGAIVFGKTNTPFYAADFQCFNKVYGTTNNPWDLSRTPGGSSGGSAAALAMGFTPLELGSDIGGSLRIPAHFTGVYGHKPTYGVVPRYGHIPPSPRANIPPHIVKMLPLSVVGPMARSADDLEFALDVLTTAGKANEGGKRPELLPAPKKPFKDYRVAVWFTDPYSETDIDAQAMKTLQKTVGKLRAAGLQVEQARPDIDLTENRKVFLGIYNAIRAKSLPGGEITARQKKLQEKWAALFEKYDVLLAPVSVTLAFPHTQTEPKAMRKFMVNGQKRRYMSNATWTIMAVVAGLPVTAAPVGLSDSGLPVGVQIISAQLKDRTTIDFAKGLAKLVGGFKPPPGYNKSPMRGVIPRGLSRGTDRFLTK